MKLTTTNLLIAGGVILLLSNGENVRGSIEKSNTIRQEQSSFHDNIAAARREARKAGKLSKVAIDRAKNNCIKLVIDKEDKPTYFKEGQPVLDKTLNTPLRPGALICNDLGDTAVVSDDGRIADIARVSTEDEREFYEYIRRQ